MVVDHRAHAGERLAAHDLVLEPQGAVADQQRDDHALRRRLPRFDDDAAAGGLGARVEVQDLGL